MRRMGVLMRLAIVLLAYCFLMSLHILMNVAFVNYLES